jgi:hypothetical protein
MPGRQSGEGPSRPAASTPAGAPRAHRLLVLSLLGAACARPPSTRSSAPRGPHTSAASPADVPSVSSEDAGEAIELPSRRTEAARSVQLPELPASLATAPELTLELEGPPVTGEHGTRRKLISRGRHRILVRSPDDGDEWLFVQNPLDPRRVSALRIDHRKREILEYSESELRMTGVARGWSDVASLGVGVDRLAALKPTGRRQSQWGYEFVELEDVGGREGRLWWSSEAAVPLHFRADLSQASTDIRSIQPGVDAALLREPRQRYAGYAEIDVADAREAHSEHAGGETSR